MQGAASETTLRSSQRSLWWLFLGVVPRLAWLCQSLKTERACDGSMADPGERAVRPADLPSWAALLGMAGYKANSDYMTTHAC